MIETVALVVVIIVLCALIGWLDWNNRKERAKLINAIVSKSAAELRDLDFVDKLIPPKMQAKPDEQLTAIDQLDEDEYMEAINGQ